MLSVNGALIMVHGEVFDPSEPPPPPELNGSSSVVVYLYVKVADSTIEKAVNAGAKILLPVANMPWGDRTCHRLCSLCS